MKNADNKSVDITSMVMKKILSLLFAFMALFSSCQQEMMSEENSGIQTRTANSNVFTFIDECYMVWDGDDYMLDYTLIGSSDISLDKPIDILCRVWYTNGMQEDQVFARIPAGVKSYWDENSTLGENRANNGYIISNIMYVGYDYSGTMDIMGLENMDTYPWDRPSGSSLPAPIYPPSVEWTEVTYELGYPLKDIKYINDESGSTDACYTLCTSGTLVMKIVLSNLSGSTVTYKNTDFCMMGSNRAYPNPYRKNVTVYSENSNLDLLNSFTLEAGASRTIYVRTGELFKEGEESYIYDTNPPFRIALYYKDSEIAGDIIDVTYSSSMGWQKY